MHRAAAILLGGALTILAVGPVGAQSPTVTNGPDAGANPVPSAYPAPDLSAARSVCEEKGGTVQVREAMFGTNDDPSAWVDLGRSVELCTFTADDGSRIYVDTITLASPGPTIASVAYLSRLKMPEYDPNKGDPAARYCSERLAGSSAFGTGGDGGGWVYPSDPDDPIVAMCVFPDGSMIDEWGLAYHSDGTIRGADLSLEFVYQAKQHDLPPIY